MEPTYILKYTTKTITAIASPNAQKDVPYEVDITTTEDSLVQKTAKGWRTISEENGDLFIVEVVPGVPSSRFELPFAHAEKFANEAQEKLSN
jgi:hypothetical protein